MRAVRRPTAPSGRSGLPFNALAARRLRAGLGMGPEHVAHGMRVSYGLPHVTPEHVIAWERGTASPETPELTALAGVLWCSPEELTGHPRTLREHRLAHGLEPEDVARAVGLGLSAYLRMEEAGEWRGTDRQSAALAEVLGLETSCLVTVMGREERLAELLHSAVTTRWQGGVRPIAKLVPVDRRVLENVLQVLHRDYRSHLTAAPAPHSGPHPGHGPRRDGHPHGGTAPHADGSGAATGTGEDTAARDFLDRIVEHFWAAVDHHP
ncbi:helix-turn-helix domain-containing protein [Streptomyces sp. SHP 1-2]|uniref:helix-turn-helix domain-containing protein n=1 Tax=Streptomyces sp. SHP 1-2 TaxID=2769489 RepID=UPI0022371DE5|nr:helix-turn-helix transcriptional regulator [Streptomyces sp. SHP 1-2]